MIIYVISSLVILGIAIAFTNPGHLAMPETALSMLIICLVVALLVFAAIILKEHSSDEREELHILKAGRLSYLIGIVALTVGIIVQTVQHELDPWLVISLCAMVLSKMVSRLYSHFKM